MNLTYTRPGELRKPDVEVLPDGRIRITRYIAAGHGDRDLSEVTESVGTADKGVATARLIKRGMAQVAGKDAIVKTYEVIDASSETQVGLPDVQYTESGQKTMVYDFVQMSSGTYVPGVIGTTTAPGDATCVLRTEQVEDDGTTRQIRRTFINKGLLQQTDETKNNGALLLKTFVYLNDAPVPNPPTGYTLVSQQTQNPNGLETTTYVYAKGNGEVSRDIEYSNSGNQGTTGVTRTTIRYLVAPNATVQPTTLTGSVEVGRSFQDSDGHRIWTTTWAKGIGEISRSIDYDNSGNQGTSGITRTTIRYLVAPAGTVQPTTVDDSVEVGRSFEDTTGYRVWTTTWAKGTGEISQDTRYGQSSNQGGIGTTVITIRHLTLTSVVVNPITNPVGTVLVALDVTTQSGYKVWSGTYAKGTGEVSSDTQIREGGRLYLYRKTSLGTAPTTPAASILGTVQLLSSSVREDSGFQVYEYAWAEGLGEISRQTETRFNGAQTLTTIRHLTNLATVVQPTTASGVIVSQVYSNEEGYRAWTVVWSLVATTTISTVTAGQDDGSIVTTVTAVSQTGSTPSGPAGTYLVRLTEEKGSGVVTTTALYQALPPDHTEPVQVRYRKPGLAVAANPPSLQPAVTKDLLGSNSITYSTTPTNTQPYTITNYAQLYEAYKRKPDNKQFSNVKPLEGFVGNSSSVGSNVNYAGVDVETYAVTVFGSTPTTPPTGNIVIEVRCRPYLTSTAGVIVYKNEVITANV